MELTVKKLEKAAKEAKREGAYIYIVYSCGEVDIWVNTAEPRAVRMGTTVINVLSASNIEYNNIGYNTDGENYELNIQQFCDMVNKRYGEQE